MVGTDRLLRAGSSGSHISMHFIKEALRFHAMELDMAMLSEIYIRLHGILMEVSLRTFACALSSVFRVQYNDTKVNSLS